MPPALRRGALCPVNNNTDTMPPWGNFVCVIVYSGGIVTGGHNIRVHYVRGRNAREHYVQILILHPAVSEPHFRWHFYIVNCVYSRK